MSINKEVRILQNQVNTKMEELLLESICKVKEDIDMELGKSFEFAQEAVNILYESAPVSQEQFDMVLDMVVTMLYIIIKTPLAPFFKKQIDNKSFRSQLENLAIHDFATHLAKRGVKENRVRLELAKLNHNLNIKINKVVRMTIEEVGEGLEQRVELFRLSLEDFVLKGRIIDAEGNVVENETEVVKQKWNKITSHNDMVQLVEKQGYEKVRTKGSHSIYKNKEGKTTVVPYHGKQIDKGLAYAIQKQIKE